jgi:hypothetical protein
MLSLTVLVPAPMSHMVLHLTASKEQLKRCTYYGEVWIMTLREFLADSSLSLRLTEVAGVRLKRERDCVIMDKLGTEASEATDEEIWKMNTCRIYLRVETLSDLCNAAGTHITEAAMHCEEEARTESNKLWPNQVRLGPRHRKVWKDMISRLCKDRSNELFEPMGRWIDKPTKKRWEAYVNHVERTALTDHW